MAQLDKATPGINERPGELYSDCHAMGGMSTYAFEDDPRHLAFLLARYKHAAKLMEGMEHVLEVGCSDGFGTRIVRQHVQRVTAIDIDPKAINEAIENMSPRWPIDFRCSSMRHVENGGRYDAVYLLDVLEHIEPKDEKEFLYELRAFAPVCIIGTPSLESQAYASRLSKAGHVNCKSGEELRKQLRARWDQVFMFSMHDETLGTGFLPMAQYLLALCVR